MSREQDAHNKGEKDGSENRYHAPNGALAILFSTVEDGERMEAENEAYGKGFDNGYKQR